MIITPQEIQDRAAKVYVSINKLTKRAGLPNSTFWRWKEGHITNPHPATVHRLVDALEALEKEHAA